jgi:hypothetical protein
LSTYDLVECREFGKAGFREINFTRVVSEGVIFLTASSITYGIKQRDP